MSDKKYGKIETMTGEEICDILTTHGDGMSMLIMTTGLDKKRIEEIALDEGNVEQCPTCKWYCPAYELLPDGEDEPDGYCENCRVES